MRVKARWFRADGAKRPDEVGGAAAFIAFRVAQNMLGSMRKAGFDIDPGPQYFDFLAESLAFAIQCACRIAWAGFAEGERMDFATAVSQRAADHLAGNQADLLGEDAAEVRRDFIERLNRRFAEYADFTYTAEGPDFAFLRYFGSLIAERVPEKDRRWTHDQVIAIEGPQAVATMARALSALLDTGPGQAPRRAASTAGE